MKLILKLLLFATLAGYSSLYAQQLPQYTQYMFNDFIINPAITGTQDYYQIKSDNRYQWVGITDAPRTYILSLYGPHKTKNMGFGGYVFSDVTGPTSRTGLFGSYGYNLKLTETIRLAFGLSVGLLQFKIDASKINFRESNDPIKSVTYTAYVPDATFGMYVYAEKFFAGLSASQLFNNKVNFYDTETNTLNRIKNHFFLTGGYRYKLNDNFTIEPSLMLKYVAPAPPQVDITAKVSFKNVIWGGLSYRTMDAISVILGYNLADQLFFGYSYDISTSSIRKYSSGTHEILIGARFNKIKKETRPKAEL